MRKATFAALLMLSGYALAEDSATVISTESPTHSSFSFTDHLLFSNTKDTSDPDAEVMNLFQHEDTARGEYGNLGVDINFSNRYAMSGDQSGNKPINLEKKTLSVAKENWDVKLGDSNQEFGKGIALSLYNNSVFGVNHTLEGAALNVHPNSFKAQLMAGRVNPLKAPVALNPEAYPIQGETHYLAAASVGGNLTSSTKASTHFVEILRQDDGNPIIKENSHTAGVTLEKEGLLEDVDLYAESNVLVSTSRFTGADVVQPVGYGSYASVVWSPSPWKAKLEYKDYRNYERYWARVPTLEDDLIVSLHNTDVSAFRLYGERKIGESRATVYASYLFGEDRTSGNPIAINHPILGTKIPLPNHAEAESKVGYRVLPNHEYLVHASGKGKLRTGVGQYLELEIKKQFGRSELEKFNYTELDKYTALLTYTFSEKISTTLGYEYVPTNEYAQGQHFPSVGAVYRTGDIVARGFVGQTSGGSQCSGGMCRQVPAFTGAMAETTVSF